MFNIFIQYSNVKQSVGKFVYSLINEWNVNCASRDVHDYRANAWMLGNFLSY